MKKPTGSIRFYKSETEKKPNLNRKKKVKPKKTKSNRVFVLTNPIKTSRFEPALVNLKKNFNLNIFLIKTKQNKK